MRPNNGSLFNSGVTNPSFNTLPVQLNGISSPSMRVHVDSPAMDGLFDETWEDIKSGIGDVWDASVDNFIDEKRAETEADIREIQSQSPASQPSPSQPGDPVQTTAGGGIQSLMKNPLAVGLGLFVLVKAIS